MDKLIKVEARKQFSNGKYVLREVCDLQFAGESRAKYVSESAVSVAADVPPMCPLYGRNFPPADDADGRFRYVLRTTFACKLQITPFPQDIFSI